MKKTIALSSTAVTALVLSASMAFAAGTHPVTGEALADDQTFTYATIDDSPSFDPGLVEDVEGSAVTRDLFEGLMMQDREGNVIPAVATGYEVSEDKLTYTFTLRPEAMWSDGTPVTANDFVFAWQRAANPETASPYAWFIELMSIEGASEIIAGEADPSTLGVSAPDDHTLVVTLTNPLPYFPQMVTHTTTFPVPQHVVEAHGDQWMRPENFVGNGAYVMTEYNPQEKLVRTKSDTYWDAENVIIETVNRVIINDENQALNRWIAGEIDKTETVPAGQFSSLSEEYPGEVYSVPELCSYYYNVNVRDDAPEWAKDVRVRQALSLAIDRDIITEFVLGAGQTPAYTFTPGATAGFDVPEVPAAAMTQAERNEAAMALMAEAGYGADNPLSVEILYNTSEAHKSVAIAISQMWKQTLGIDTTLGNMEWQTFLEARGNGQFEISRAGWCGDYNEASTFLDLMDSESGYNDAGYNNPAVDELLAAAKTMEDPSANYTEIEHIIAEDMPIIPIYHYASAFLMDESVKGWPFDNVQNNWQSSLLYKVAE
ncbi:oligopeptide ABC transporter substrate-binding protein OppA [Marivivens niveibacter]|uniref:Oligopeptide ABC transporter substrate-binding protein OppA n=1 Tax=Marivivens niveibacter TaxID=1930667 RepID=A0A251X0W5_9RHOB|nr:peptide ABC transporter substrate-binding protein [Marivivens niveibacter]OUD10035.1 oligopeptide ABC transporter substrate-binding protein OppA [Marivivens niveibacter]